MPRRRAVCVAAALIASGCADDAIDRARPFPSAVPLESVVAVRASGCRPTQTKSVGVVLAPGLVATVAHSVAGESEITVRDAEGDEHPATVAAIDTDADAALLRVDGLRAGPVPRLDRDAVPAGPATRVAFPDAVPTAERITVRREVTVRTTDIYRIRPVRRPGLELGEAEVAPGDSGGGVFRSGVLIGIVWATSREDEARAWATGMAAYGPLLSAVSSGEPVPAVACSR